MDERSIVPPGGSAETVAHAPAAATASPVEPAQTVAAPPDSATGGSAVRAILESIGVKADVPRVRLRGAAGDDAHGGRQPDPALGPAVAAGGRYQVLGEIARGGMGAVLRGRDVDLGRDLAIKVLLEAHTANPEVVQRFVEEAQIGGQLQHPGIAPIYEFGQFADKRPFFAMKLVEGRTLANLLRARKDLAEERGRFLGIFENVCQTMAYAHSRGVIHRDLKPANIMVGAFGEVQVMDWGLAKILHPGGDAGPRGPAVGGEALDAPADDRTASVAEEAAASPTGREGLTRLGSVMGTPAYMPPEQALGEIHQLDERADVFGLGAILCEILTGKPPYVQEAGRGVVRMASQGELEACFARLDASTADPELVSLTKQCLQPDPASRPRDAGALARRVRGHLESVEARLRAAETERAAQAARADSEAARVAAERRRAEAESRALEQQRQATRKLRRLLVGLAAVAVVAVGTSLVAGWSWQVANTARREAEGNESLARTAAQRADASAAAARESRAMAEDQAARAEQQRVRAEENLAKATTAERETAVQRDRADEKAEQARQNLYVAQMHLARQAFGEYRGFKLMRDLLGNWLPENDARDRRGWEWFYLDAFAHRGVRNLAAGATRGALRTVAWHPGSNRLAEGLTSGLIRIWDVEQEQVTLTLDVPPALFTFWARDWLALSPDGELLAAGFEDATVRLWNPRTGEEVRILREHRAPILAVGFSGDGSRLAACATDGAVRIWNVRTGAETARLTHPGSATAGVWSPDGSRYATGHSRGEITVSDAGSGDTVATWRPYGGRVYCLAWSPDGRRIATSGENGIEFVTRVWDVASRKPVLPPLRHAHAVTAIAWHPDGAHLATGTMAEDIRIWDAATGREVNALVGHVESISSFSWGPGQSLASASGDSTVKIWTSIHAGPSTVLPAAAAVHSVAWSPDAERVAAGDDGGRVIVWDATSGRRLADFQAHERGFEQKSTPLGSRTSVAWSPDGHRLVSASLDGRLRVWEAGTDREICRLPGGGTPVWCVAWSPDGRTIAAGGEDGRIRLVAAHDPAVEPRVFERHADGRLGVLSVAFSPEGDRLASSSVDGLVRVWDLHRGVEIGRLERHVGFVFDVAWRPDGKRLATCGTEGATFVWDAATGRRLADLRGPKEFVVGVAWNPEGTRLASVHFGGAVQVWDPETAQECCSLGPGGTRLQGVSWSADGGRLAAGTTAGEVHIWDATPGLERDTTARALPYLDRALASGQMRSPDRRRAAERYAAAGLPEKALAAVGDDPRASLDLAGWLAGRGDHDSAAAARRRARGLLEAWLAAGTLPDTASAAALAGLLLEEAAAEISWTIVRPTELRSREAAELSLQEDGSILAGGPSTEGDVYTLEAPVDLEAITAVRIEALPDERLPRHGPGRHDSGNFHLRALRLLAGPPDARGNRLPAAFSGASASFDFRAHDADVAGLVKPDLRKVWHVWGRSGRANHAVLRTAAPVATAGVPVVFELEHGAPLGRFRIAVSGSPGAFERQRDCTGAASIPDPWARLAAACRIRGDEPQVERILEQRPGAAIPLADWSATIGDWEAAAALYGRRITSDTTDGDFLLKRARAWLALARWSEADDDLVRAVKLEPRLLRDAIKGLLAARRWDAALRFARMIVDVNHPDTLVWLNGAPVAARAGAEPYGEFCRRFAERFRETTDPVAAERVIKGCLLRPGGIDIKTLPVPVLERAMEEKTLPEWHWPWAWSTRALLAWRSDDAAAALGHVERSAALSPPPGLTQLNLALRALAERRLGHAEQGDHAADELSRLLERDRAAGRDGDHDLLIVELLLEEARALARRDGAAD